MYCIKCGVELAEGQESCPLCATRVCHPDIKPDEGKRPFPHLSEPLEEINRNGILFILTFIFLVPLLLCLVCDLTINGKIDWSGYTTGAIALIYIIIVLPLWFRRPNPVIFVPADFAAAGLFLMYINIAADGDWFLTFAFPVIGTAGIITTAVVTLVKYLKNGLLYIFGGAFLLSGASMILVEFLTNLTFRLSNGFKWCFYPLIVFSLIGIMLIIIAVCPPLRESLRKKLFL